MANNSSDAAAKYKSKVIYFLEGLIIAIGNNGKNKKRKKGKSINRKKEEKRKTEQQRKPFKDLSYTYFYSIISTKIC